LVLTRPWNLTAVAEIAERLSTAIADRSTIEREIGQGCVGTVRILCEVEDGLTKAFLGLEQ